MYNFLRTMPQISFDLYGTTQKFLNGLNVIQEV